MNQRNHWKRYSAASGVGMLMCLVTALGVMPVGAQVHLIQGSVLAAADESPLPGVNIVEVGTTTGTTTDFDGAFSLMVSNPNATISASFVGFVTQTIPVNGRTDLVIMMEEDVALLEEVVVTAFGIERQARAVGFSVSEVQGEELRQARENNVANALSGKIAGVVVSKPATGPSGSSRVIIRGSTSLEGNNQPLYVVDGIPIDNRNLGSAGMWGGQDLGDGISSVNPDDIENISVLKGPAAAALYGTRAQNGVILITTKSGTRAGPGGGIGVEYSANVTFEDPVVRYDFQEEYGQGLRGAKPDSWADALAQGRSSWGARLDGSPAIQFDGVSRPYSLVSDRMDRFYETGVTNTNTVAFTGRVEKTAVRFSMSRLNSQSIVPNSGLERYTLSLRGTSDFGDRLSADVKVNYVREDNDNRAQVSDSPRNANYAVAFLPNNVNPEDMEPGFCQGDPNPNAELGICAGGTNENEEFRTDESVFVQNPYWSTNAFRTADTKDRLIGHMQLSYKLLDWLSVSGRAGQDWYATRRTWVQPFGTAFSPTGSMEEVEWRVQERNYDFLFSADRDINADFGVNATLGGNKLRQDFERLALSGSDFSIPGLETISNAASSSLGYDFSVKEINSVYASAEVGYRNYAFLTLTGRNDWSSTLPSDKNSFFYPSISGSFVFSDAFDLPSWLTFGKIRASWAEVGGDTDPYRLKLTYQLANFTHAGQPVGRVAQTEIPLSTLKPSSHQGWEVGFDTRLLDNRAGIDFTFYSSKTTDQILRSSVPGTSGYNSKVINAGEMKNKGIELLLSGTPVRTPDMRWDVDFNVGWNDNEVVQLLGDPACGDPFPSEDLDCTNFLSQLALPDGTSRVADGNTMRIFAEVGQPYGVLRGYQYARDSAGNIVLDDSGLPVQGDFGILGNGNPDWTGGITNTFRYKNVTLSTLVDISVGGEIFSGTNAIAYGFGLHKNTLEGRSACESAGYDTECWVPSGVQFPGGIPFEVGDKGVDGLGPGDDGYSGPDQGEGNDVLKEIFETGTANTTAVYPQDYFGAISSRIAEEFVYDASYVKLRQVQLSFRLPAKWLRRSPIKMATASLVARNLWIIHKNTPNFDPESNINIGNSQGIELAGVPQSRSIGFNINMKL